VLCDDVPPQRVHSSAISSFSRPLSLDPISVGDRTQGRATPQRRRRLRIETDAPVLTGLLGSQHYQAEMGSPRDRFSSTVGVELGEDRRDMELGGVERDS
jgi:hypothetical protein